ncbi:hypothetical protein TELCIR_07978 [Teladorsagia circumcincta]|uniref:Uncharacterized protein n=1 Tax=Teladorsagia circumcincta TaxID=45464 RepID=A0A2G9UIV4_TELCI|nr:hypothetical protein TELCIR_07978 [Teladorsagia circumcincta]
MRENPPEPMKTGRRNQNILLKLNSLEIIENFADLVTQCMFSEKRKVKEVKTMVENASVLSPELLSVLDSFYGVGRPKQQKFNRDDSKSKLHRVNDEQLIELSQFMQKDKQCWRRRPPDFLDRYEQARNSIAPY